MYRRRAIFATELWLVEHDLLDVTNWTSETTVPHKFEDALVSTCVIILSQDSRIINKLIVTILVTLVVNGALVDASRVCKTLISLSVPDLEAATFFSWKRTHLMQVATKIFQGSESSMGTPVLLIPKQRVQTISLVC